MSWEPTKDKAYLYDLLSDLRCAERDGMDSYAASLREEYRQITGREPPEKPSGAHRPQEGTDGE